MKNKEETISDKWKNHFVEQLINVDSYFESYILGTVRHEPADFLKVKMSLWAARQDLMHQKNIVFAPHPVDAGVFRRIQGQQLGDRAYNFERAAVKKMSRSKFQYELAAEQERESGNNEKAERLQARAERAAVRIHMSVKKI